jgi:hypothetical protein
MFWDRVYVVRKWFKGVHNRIGGFMNTSRQIFQNMPNPAGQVEIQGINVMNFGDSMEMVTLKTHGKEWSLKDGSSHVGIKMGIKWNKFVRLHRYGWIIRKGVAKNAEGKTWKRRVFIPEWGEYFWRMLPHFEYDLVINSFTVEGFRTR